LDCQDRDETETFKKRLETETFETETTTLGLDIFCSLFQIETIVENDNAALQQRQSKNVNTCGRRMS